MLTLAIQIDTKIVNYTEKISMPLAQGWHRNSWGVPYLKNNSYVGKKCVQSLEKSLQSSLTGN